MEHVRFNPAIHTEPDGLAVGWCGVEVFKFLVMVVGLKDCFGRLPPKFQKREWLAREWDLKADSIPGVTGFEPIAFISAGVEACIREGWIIVEADGTWFFRDWELFYGKAKTPAERTAKWRAKKAAAASGGRDAGDDVTSRRHGDVGDATPLHSTTYETKRDLGAPPPERPEEGFSAAADLSSGDSQGGDEEDVTLGDAVTSRASPMSLAATGDQQPRSRRRSTPETRKPGGSASTSARGPSLPAQAATAPRPKAAPPPPPPALPGPIVAPRALAARTVTPTEVAAAPVSHPGPAFWVRLMELRCGKEPIPGERPKLDPEHENIAKRLDFAGGFDAWVRYWVGILGSEDELLARFDRYLDSPAARGKRPFGAFQYFFRNVASYPAPELEVDQGDPACSVPGCAAGTEGKAFNAGDPSAVPLCAGHMQHAQNACPEIYDDDLSWSERAAAVLAWAKAGPRNHRVLLGGG